MSTKETHGILREAMLLSAISASVVISCANVASACGALVRLWKGRSLLSFSAKSRCRRELDTRSFSSLCAIAMHGARNRAVNDPAHFGGSYHSLEQRLAPLKGRLLRNRADELYVWKIVDRIPYYVGGGPEPTERMFRRHKDLGHSLPRFEL